MTARYASWCDVLDYCRRSANPVGRLVLRIAGYRDEALDRSSDALCTALQLTNFWQDFGRDWRIGRLYVPREIQDACGASEADLASGRMPPAWARAIEACGRVDAPPVRRRTGRVRRACADACVSSCGSHGSAACASSTAPNAAASTLLDRRPTLGIGDAPWLLWRALWWSRRAGTTTWARPDGAKDQLLLFVPRAAGRATPRHRRRLGFLPRRRRCGG